MFQSRLLSFLKLGVFASTPWVVYSFVSCTFSLQLSGSTWACAKRHWLSAGLRHEQVASHGTVKHVSVAHIRKLIKDYIFLETLIILFFPPNIKIFWDCVGSVLYKQPTRSVPYWLAENKIQTSTFTSVVISNICGKWVVTLLFVFI